MKKIVILAAIMLLCVSCGVGNYSISAGRSDTGFICVTASTKYPITIKIDDSTYSVNTIKTTAYKSGRDIKMTAINSIVVPSGQHEVEISKDGKVVAKKKVLVSINETKIIEL